jgi:hypothetical protein
MKTSQAYALGFSYIKKHLPRQLIEDTRSCAWFYGLTSHIGFLINAGEMPKVEKNLKFYETFNV